MHPDHPYVISSEDWGNPFGFYGPQLPDYATTDYSDWLRRRNEALDARP